MIFGKLPQEIEPMWLTPVKTSLGQSHTRG